MSENDNGNRPDDAVYYVDLPRIMLPSSCMNFYQVPCIVPDSWASTFYHEFKTSIGEGYNALKSSFIIDGFTDPSSSERFCLGMLSNVNRTDRAETIRRLIGRGVKIYCLGNEVYAECLGQNNIFVQSPIFNRRHGFDPGYACKLNPGAITKIFNNEEFANLLNQSVKKGFEAVYQLTQMCIIRISFVKGWGPNYKRPEITSLPCWVEIQLNGPLQWLDRVLVQIGPPGQKCNSKT